MGRPVGGARPPSFATKGGPGLPRRNGSCSLAEGRLREKPPRVCGKHLAQGAQTTKRVGPRLLFPSQPSHPTQANAHATRIDARTKDSGMRQLPPARSFDQATTTTTCRRLKPRRRR
ncbi:hypothetical protein MTO96_027598 [Rhipicephalus appendiculatus]